MLSNFGHGPLLWNCLGLFAAALGYKLAAGNDSSDVSFDQGKMREHLVQRLEKGCFELFPRRSNTARLRKRKNSDIDLFCHCLMPECWDDMSASCARNGRS